MTQSGNLTCVVPDWPVSSKVTAFTTTRLGGVSKPPFNTLNLGLHVGDEQEAVQENRRRLRQCLGLPGEPVWLKQTHSTTMVDVDEDRLINESDQEIDRRNNMLTSQRIGEKASTASTTNNLEADGSYTRQPNTVLAVLTADCLPVVISDTDGTQLAVVHAGWRGLANGFLVHALARFQEGSELHAWLGPAIGPSKFEVGEEVMQAFVSRSSENNRCFTKGEVQGKYWADLYALAGTELELAGCLSVSGGDYCTHSQSRLFHSHRRDGVASGRMATVAWLAPH